MTNSKKLINLLKKKKLKISFAESCTGGLCQVLLHLTVVHQKFLT